MGLYLAYGMNEEDLSWKQLEDIMTDCFDMATKGQEDFQRWLESSKRRRRKFLDSKVVDIVKRNSGNDKSALRFAAYFGPCSLVKDHPLLEIAFGYESSSPHSPSNFSGLNIWASHCGSERVVDMLKFKPEIERYLAIQRIPYRDLCFTQI